VVSGTVFSAGHTISTLIAYPIYLKYLGVEKYGLWAIVSVVFSFSQIGLAGIDTAITKYIASEYGQKKFRGITEYISTSFYILLVPSLILICLLALFKSQLSDFIKLKEVFRDKGVQLIFFVGLLSVFSFFVNAIKGVVVGIGRMDIANYSLLISRIIQVTLSVCLLLLGFEIWSLYWGFFMYFFFPLIVWVIVLSCTYQITIFNPLAFDRQKMKELVKYGGTLLIRIITQMFVTPFNTVIIGRYIGLSEVVYYQIAVQVVISARNLFVKGLESMLPMVSEVYGKSMESFTAVFSIHKKGMKLIFLFVSPLFLSLFIFADIILELWLGEKFNMQIAVVLRILLIGWFINTLAVPDYFMFLGIGKVGYCVSATWIKCITNVTLVFLLLFLNLNITLNKVVVIDSFSLVMAMIFLKFKYFEFKKLMRVTQL